MNRYLLGMALAGATTVSAVPASAAEKPVTVTATLPDRPSSDFNGAAEIIRGDYTAAERTISAQMRLWPTDADLLLNLAYVFRHTGRPSEARALYRSVLTRPDEVVDTQDRGSHWSRTLAQAALASMDGTQLTAR